MHNRSKLSTPPSTILSVGKSVQISKKFGSCLLTPKSDGETCTNLPSERLKFILPPSDCYVVITGNNLVKIFNSPANYNFRHFLPHGKWIGIQAIKNIQIWLLQKNNTSPIEFNKLRAALIRYDITCGIQFSPLKKNSTMNHTLGSLGCGAQINRQMPATTIVY